MHLLEQAPLLRGCPDRGGERRQREGPTRCTATCGATRRARRVPRQIRTWSLQRNSRCPSTHDVDLRMHLEKQAPLLRGCPDRGGERPAKGGARPLHVTVWGDAKSASRPAPDKEKGLPFGSPFSLSGGEGGIVGCIHAPDPSALRAPGPAYGCPVLLLQNRRTPSGVLIPPHQRCRSLQQPPASPERWPRKKPPSGRLSSLSGGEGGIRTPEAL